MSAITGLGSSAPFEALAREQAERRGWTFERKTGDRRLINRLLNGEWAEEDFLVVPPDQHVALSGDSGLIAAAR